MLNMHMNPNSPYQPQQNPYAFLNETGPAPKKPFFAGSLKGRIILIGGALLLIIIIFSVASSLLSSGSKGTVTSLKDIITKQQEIVRVAELGAVNSTSVDTRNFAKTVALTVQTDQTKVLEALTKNKAKMSASEQAAGLNAKTDQILEAAKANNQYDNVLTDTLASQLNAYLTVLKSTYDKTNGPNTKEVLSRSYTNATTLMAPSQAAQ